MQVATAYESGGQVQWLLCGVNDHSDKREDIFVLQLPQQITFALEGGEDVSPLVWAERPAHSTNGLCIVA
jgi:hypothetical protein